MSSREGVGWFLSRAYMDITIPGVQKPHWEPWILAIRSYAQEGWRRVSQFCFPPRLRPLSRLTCTGWILVLELPRPSTVVTAAPCSWQMGSRQALAEECLTLGEGGLEDGSANQRAAGGRIRDGFGGGLIAGQHDGAGPTASTPAAILGSRQPD